MELVPAHVHLQHPVLLPRLLRVADVVEPHRRRARAPVLVRGFFARDESCAVVYDVPPRTSPVRGGERWCGASGKESEVGWGRGASGAGLPSLSLLEPSRCHPNVVTEGWSIGFQFRYYQYSSGFFRRSKASGCLVLFV